MNATGRLLSPLIILFVLINIIVAALGSTLKTYNIDPNVMLAGNALFFLISIFSFLIQRSGLQNKNPHVFVRSVMTGMMLKMVFCIVAVIAYVYLSGSAYNKRGIFITLFLYLIYLATEVYAVMKMNKNKNANA
ncbi:hypothetical protein BH11BAC4_BH11BAC4_03170 [soil metagenome]